MVREQFEAACTTVMEPVTRSSDPFALPRIDMYYFAYNDRFSRLGEGAFARYVWFRKKLRSLRTFVTA